MPTTAVVGAIGAPDRQMRSTWASAATTTTGNSTSPPMSAKARPVLPAVATMTPAAPASWSRWSVGATSRSLNEHVGQWAPRSGHQPLKAIQRSSSPSRRPSASLRYVQPPTRPAPGWRTGSQSVKRHSPRRWSLTWRRGYSATSIPSGQQSTQYEPSAG